MATQSQHWPPGERPRVLLVGDDPQALRELRDHVHSELGAASVTEIESTQGLDNVGAAYDVVLFHHDSGTDAVAAVDRFRTRHTDCPLLVVMELEQKELAAELIRYGASTYILKTPRYGPRLRAALTQWLGRSRQRRLDSGELQASREQLRQLLDHSSQGVLLQIDSEIVFANAALARILGYGHPDEVMALGSIYEFVDPWDRPRLRRIVKQRAQGRAPDRYEFRARRRDGRLIWLENHVSMTTWEQRPVVQCVLSDVSERHLAGNALRLAGKVTARAGDAGDFDTAVLTTLRWLARGMGWTLAESWIPDPDSGVLRRGPAWHRGGEALQGFVDKSADITFQHGEGLPGRVWSGRAPEWIADLSESGVIFRRSILALGAGLRAACGIPIVARGEVVLVLCFYLDHRQAEHATLVRALFAGAASLGPVLHRIRADTARRAARSQIETLIESNADGILVVDREARILFANPAAQTAFGRDFESLRGMLFGTPAVSDTNTAEIEIWHPRHGLRIHEMRAVDIEWHDAPARVVSLRDVTENHRIKRELETNQAALKERIKELGCLYAVSDILMKQETDTTAMLQKVVDAIPPGWMYPDSTCARLSVQETTVVSNRFRETEWRLVRGITLKGEELGSVEVFYLEEKPERDIGPFLHEENELLGDMANRIGQAIAARRYQSQLEASRRRFRDFAEAASDWLWETDENLRFSYFSDRMQEVLEVPAAELIGRTREDLTPEVVKDDPKWVQHLETLKAHCPFKRFRYSITLRDGREKHVTTSGVPVFDGQGKFRGYRGTANDVTWEVDTRQQLEYSRQRFKDFAESASDWLWEMDEHLRFTYLSERFEEVTDQPKDRWIGRSRFELTPECTDDPKWQAHRADLDARRPFKDFRYEFTLPGGETRHAAISGVPVFDEKGAFQGYRGTGTDETQEVRARALARESARRLQGIADRLPGVVFQRLRRSDGTVEYPYVSAGVTGMLGLEEQAVKDDPLAWADHIEADDRARFDLALAESARTLEPMELTFRMRTTTGGVRWVWHRSRPLELDDGDILWDCIELDITRQKEYEARVRYLGHYDQTTGLPNRDRFIERVDEVLPIASRNGQPVSVAVLDLKQFKRVNEELGMAGGDEVLRRMAERFQACLRPGDTVARMDGDRFLFLLPGVGEDPATHVPLERLLQAANESLTIRDQQILLSFNMGIAMFPKDGGSPDELIQRADIAQAHYRTWGPGYGYAFFQDRMLSTAASSLTLQRELKDAVDSGDQIEGFFQPIYDVRTGRIVAAETLARWQHPERGLVSPAKFIDMAEDTGLIIPMGYQVFRQACISAKDWRAAGLPPVDVSINLSAKQIFDPELAAHIKRILAETGFTPRRVVLEVTESLLISNLGHARSFMQELVAEGVRFALDDFGVGYSSLQYLSQLPVQMLKIDRSFIRDMNKSPRNEATVKAMVALGRALDLQIVAEGVETAEQLSLIERLGCDSVQGYYFDRPMPAPEFEQRLASRG